MEIKVNIGYQKILELIFQLSEKDINKLMNDIKKKENQKHLKTISTSDFQKLLLQVPTWSDKEYADFLKGEKHFNQFRSL